MVIKADVLSSTSAQFYFDYDQNLWKRVKVGYWATDRSDITVGQGIASKFYDKYRFGIYIWRNKVNNYKV